MDEKTKAIRQLDEARAEAAEAELARIKSAEGCDVEGAHRAYDAELSMDGRPYDAVDAALAVGCAPLRAEIEKMEAVFRWLLGEEGLFPERLPGDGLYWWRGYLRKRLSALKEPANG